MKIILGTFKDNGSELAEFLEPRVGAKPLFSGSEITIDDDSIKKTIKTRHVKTYVKRFLWKKGERRNYRVLVQGKEFRLIELEPSEAEEEERKKAEERKEEQAEKTEEPKAAEVKEAEANPKEEPKPETPAVVEEKAPAAKEPRKKAKKPAEKGQPAASP